MIDWIFSGIGVYFLNKIEKFTFGKLEKEYIKNYEQLCQYNSKDLFKNKSKFIRILFEEPKIKISDETFFAPIRDTKYKKIIEAKEQDNDPHAVFKSTNDINWNDNPPVIYYQTILYSQLLALHNQNIKPIMISCGALLISNETEELILHRRSSSSRTYPNKQHIFGGVMLGQTQMARYDKSCWETAKREIKEEIGIELQNGKYPIYVGEELDTNFLQIVFLGVPISKKQLNSVVLNWEGEITRVPFDKIQHCFINHNDYVPTALMHIRCWLDLGAPGAKNKYKKYFKDIDT